jgi:predicted amidohydrolase YtcJ
VLLQQVRLVPVTAPAPDRPVDVRIRGGVVTEVGSLTPDDEEVVQAGGRWLIPGLWDAHVHLRTWSRRSAQLDLSGTTSPEEVLALVAGRVRELGDSDALVMGHGYRSGSWPREATVVELDAVCGNHPVALISADVHNGWLNSRALAALGVADRTGPLEEAEWFAVMARLGELGGADLGVGDACEQAASKGVVGIADMEMEAGFDLWPERVEHGVDVLRVRTATYASTFDRVLSAGLRTGQVLDRQGLVTMGPLKVIFDGSLNTRTAYCCAPYPGRTADWRGVLNLEPAELLDLCTRASQAGIEVALHAIGDAAVTLALDAIETSGATGSVEHAQLVARTDIARFAALGVRASVQPAHLLDDRDLTAELWPGAEDRCFALRSLLDAGADVRFGSDAPVSALDPWLAMAAAVHRSADDRPSWTPSEQISPKEALAASTDGQGTVRPGSRGDLALLDSDPLSGADPRGAADCLRSMRVAATVVGGRVTQTTLS